MSRLLATLSTVGLVLSCLVPSGAVLGQQKANAAADPARSFFAAMPVVKVHIALDAAARQSLRDEPRHYVAASLQIDDAKLERVGIKLKGAAGSFQQIDERPAFTVNLAKFGGEARCHGLLRFHLNNGAQDESRLCEWLGSEVFAAAGLPAPRVAHAIVWLDDTLLGLYVFREGFDAQFLQRAFGTEHGNLYDGGFCQDVDGELEKDGGDGPDDRSDLLALRELCDGVDQRRAARLVAAIDVPKFVDFTALEAMLCHWDGYAQNVNNYRLWLPVGGKAVFLPHGMDQLFGDAEASILDHPSAIVASAVLQVPASRRRYRDRLRALLPLFAPEKLRPRLEAVAAAVQRALRPIDAEAAGENATAVADLIGRVEARYANLVVQVRAPEPVPLLLAKGRSLPLKDWLPAAETDGVSLLRRDLQNVTALRTQLEGRSEAPRRGLWRTHVLLGPGHYELRATVRCLGVEPPADTDEGQANGGVVLRAGDACSERLRGDVPWRPLACAFAVDEFQRNVELVCDLEAFTGSVWFRVDSLQLFRVPDGN